LGRDPVGPVGQLVDPPELPLVAGEAGHGLDLAAVGTDRERALGAGDADAVIGRAEIATGLRLRCDQPVLVGAYHVGREVDADGAFGPGRTVFGERLVGYRSDRIVRTGHETAPRVERDAHEIGPQLQRVAAALGLDLVRACLDVAAGDGPTVAPQQRLDRQHAATAAVHVRLVVQRELLEPSAEIDVAEMPGAYHAALCRRDELAAAAKQRHAHVVDVRAEHRARAAHADVI